ncbi:ABC transporter substrate-binding protein [Pseudonocardia lutea]|jgi:ABC-type branched-subunit amino acid transport system substrate-binding protein|uniref:ABC transporter substrate-binding protein n=1 Tax=Pseudonocardia lutea TaxID=2172015 RepID=A0ABW1IGV5_9PSEU
MRRSRRVRALAALALGAVLALAGCGAGGRPDSGSGGSTEGGGSTVGITADTVKVGSHFPLTGVAAPGYSEIPTGTKAYFDWVNANGGVNGRKIDYVFRDDAYNPTQTSQVVNELVLQDQVFAVLGGLGTPTHGAVLDFLNAEGVPDLFVSSGSLLWDQPQKYPMTFGWQPDYEVEAKILADHVAKTFPQARVGLFLQNDDVGQDAERGIRRYLDRQIVSVQRYTPGNTDIGPQMSALQAANADLVIGFNVPSYTALTQLQGQKLNYKPQWVYSNIGADPVLVGSLLGRFSQGQVTDSSLLNGIITDEYLPRADNAADPWTAQFDAIWKAHGDGGPLTNFRIFGMSQGYAFVQALLAAGPNPTRQGLVEAIEKGGTQFQGPWAAPYRFTPDKHSGMSGVKVVQVTGQSTKALTPVRTTTNGDAPITDATNGETPVPPNGIPTAPGGT